MTAILEGVGLALLIVAPVLGFALAAFAGDDRWSVLFGWWTIWAALLVCALALVADR